MNWKRLGKLILALALAAAMFVSLVPVARAEDSSPRDPITDEVDDSTIINGDGGGTGSGGSGSGTGNEGTNHDETGLAENRNDRGYGGTRYRFFCNGEKPCYHDRWLLRYVDWDVSDDGEVKAYAHYGCGIYSMAGDFAGEKYIDNGCRAVVPLTVEPVEGQPGSYQATVYHEYYSYIDSGGVPEVFVGPHIYGVRFPGGRINHNEGHSPHTETMSIDHTDKWIFDRFEWDMTGSCVKANALYHCKYNCNEKTVAPAEVREISSGCYMAVVGYSLELIGSSFEGCSSPDGGFHCSSEIRRNHTSHDWVCDGFEWDTSGWDASDFVWDEGVDVVSFARTHLKVNLVFHCPYGCGETCSVPVSFGRTGATSRPTATALSFDVCVFDDESPDHWDHYDRLTIKHSSHEWTFDGLEWDTSDGVKATAHYHCANAFCHGLRDVSAIVTNGDSGTAVHTYQAVITAGMAPDGNEFSETKTIHSLVFKGFEWDLTNFTAKALFECSCGEQHRVDAEMSYPNGNHAKAYVSKYVTPDHTAHEETREVDFGDYLPYTWEIGAIYEFKGFEWDGYKAYACYYHCKCVGSGTFSKETVKVEAVVTRLSYTVAPQYRARIAAWQTPDGVEHTEVKTIVIPPDPGPIVPRVREDLIGPPREMKPGDWIIGPVAGLNPRNP